ncbi:MAG: hypothetical protein ABI321_12735 [Polyangia bacterium]
MSERVALLASRADTHLCVAQSRCARTDPFTSVFRCASAVHSHIALLALGVDAHDLARIGVEVHFLGELDREPLASLVAGIDASPYALRRLMARIPALALAVLMALFAVAPVGATHRCLRMNRPMPPAHACCPRTTSAVYAADEHAASMSRPCCESIAGHVLDASEPASRPDHDLAAPQLVGLMVALAPVDLDVRPLAFEFSACGRAPGERLHRHSSVLRV